MTVTEIWDNRNCTAELWSATNQTKKMGANPGAP
jgi:hypothetical protein